MIGVHGRSQGLHITNTLQHRTWYAAAPFFNSVLGPEFQGIHT